MRTFRSLSKNGMYVEYVISQAQGICRKLSLSRVWGLSVCILFIRITTSPSSRHFGRVVKATACYLSRTMCDSRCVRTRRFESCRCRYVTFLLLCRNLTSRLDQYLFGDDVMSGLLFTGFLL